MTSLLQKSVELLLLSCLGNIMCFSFECTTLQYLIKTNTQAKRKSSYRATKGVNSLREFQNLVTHCKPLLHQLLNGYLTPLDDVTESMLLILSAFGKYMFFFSCSKQGEFQQ